MLIPKPYYYYFHRGDSITTKPYAEKDLAYIDIYQKFYNEVVKNYPDLKEVAFSDWPMPTFFILDKMLLDDQYKQFEAYSQIHRFLKGHALAIARNPIFRKGRRISALALFINISLYRFLLLKNIEKIRDEISDEIDIFSLTSFLLVSKIKGETTRNLSYPACLLSTNCDAGAIFLIKIDESFFKSSDHVSCLNRLWDFDCQEFHWIWSTVNFIAFGIM